MIVPWLSRGDRIPFAVVRRESGAGEEVVGVGGITVAGRQAAGHRACALPLQEAAAQAGDDGGRR